MGALTVEQVAFLLQLIEREYGRGYSHDPAVGQLQAKLSIMAEMASQRNRHSDPINLRTSPRNEITGD